MGAAPQSALMADAAFARPTVDAQLFTVHRTLVVLAAGTAEADAAVLADQTVRLDVGADLLQTLHLHGNVLQPAAVDQLVDVQRGATVRTLAALFR